MASYAAATSAAVVSSEQRPLELPLGVDLGSTSFPQVRRRMRNRVFFPQACLDQWAVDGKIELTPTELVILAEGRRYGITEVVRVVVEVTGSPDPHGIIGKVKPKAELEKLGAEILENSMIIGDNAYDVVPGWAGTPLTPYDEHLSSPERIRARGGRRDGGGAPGTEEEMLVRFASGTL